jgi:hypothetical protein
MEEQLFELVTLLLPSIIVFATAYFLIKKFVEQEYQKKLLEIRREAQKETIPIRLQAYERITLFLERISPNNLVMRVYEKNKNSSIQKLQEELLKSIRSEFDHNLSQQIYVSTASWILVKTAKESIIKLVNSASIRVHDGSPAIELSRVILQMAAEVKELPTEVAIKQLKEDLKLLFR